MISEVIADLLFEIGTSCVLSATSLFLVLDQEFLSVVPEREFVFQMALGYKDSIFRQGVILTFDDVCTSRVWKKYFSCLRDVDLSAKRC